MQRLGNNIHLTNLYGAAVLPNAKKVEKNYIPRPYKSICVVVRCSREYGNGVEFNQ